MKFAELVKLHLASGNGKNVILYEFEVYVDKVRRTRIPPPVSNALVSFLRRALCDTREQVRAK
eukprot:5201811-Amphidinium_carterae.1